MRTSARGFRFLVVSFGLLFSVSGRAGSVPVENLLSFFSSSCPSEGTWTQTALGKAAALRNTLNDIAADPDCAALSSEAGSAGAIYSSLTLLNQQSANDTTETTLIAQEQAVLSSMASTTDPAYMASLQATLTRIDAQVVATKATDRLDVQAGAAAQLIASTHGLVQQALANQKCILKRPGLLAGIGALVANVGSAVTAVNPGLGLGASAVGTLMSDLVNLFHVKKFTKAVQKVNRASLKPETISCVLESLSGDFCRARDALTSMDWAQAHSARVDYPITSALYGLGLLDREVANFSQWLETVKVARLAQTTADASRAEEFRNQEALYFSSPDLVSGVLGTYRTQLEGVNDVEKRWPIVRTMIGELVARLNNSQSVSNPLFQTKTRNEAEFFLIGIDPSKLPKVNGNVPNFDSGFSPKDADAGTPPQKLRMELPEIQSQFDSWFRDTKAYVDDLRAQILQPDVLGTLESAFSKTQDYSRTGDPSRPKTPANTVSPYHSLTAIREYLDNQLRENSGQSETYYYLPDTIGRLAKIQSSLEALHVPGVPHTAKDYANILADIYTEGNLQHGSSFLKNRFIDHINNALVRYLSDPANARDNAPILAQTLASERMTDILTKTNPKGDRGLVREDIVNSITIVLPTLTTFVETFRNEVKDVLNFIQGQEVLYGGKDSPTGRDFYYKRSKICLLLTNLAAWPNGVPFELCSGTSFTTLPDGPRSPELTAEYLAKPFDSRACGYYELQRATLIHQTKLDFKSIR